jgi:hypothetical protein
MNLDMKHTKAVSATSIGDELNANLPYMVGISWLNTQYEPHNVTWKSMENITIFSYFIQLEKNMWHCCLKPDCGGSAGY